MVEKYTAKLKSYRLLFCAGLAVLLAIYVYCNYKVFLDTDDIGIRNIISGLYTGSPDPHVLYFLYPLSFVLAGLYTILPNIPWYFLFLEAAIYGSFTAILFSVIRRAKKHTVLLTVTITALFIAFWLRYLIQPEWTTTAGLLSAAAIVWYFFIPDHTSKVKTILDYTVSVILFALSANLRFSVFEMAIPFMGMAVVVKWLKNKGGINKSFVFKEIVFIVLTLAVIAGSRAVNSAAYSGEEWQEAKAYSHYRSMLFDRYGYPDYDEYADVYEANGITKEMYEIMKDDYNFMLASEGVLTSENLKEIAELAKEIHYSDRSFLRQIRHSMRLRLDDAFSDTYIIYTNVFYIAMLFILLSALYRKSWLEAFLDAFFVVGFEAVWVYLYYGGRMLLRVGQPLYLFGFVIELILICKDPILKKLLENRTIQAIGIFITAFLLGGEIIDMQYENEASAEKALTFQEVKEYCENNKDNVYFRDVYSYASSGNNGKEIVQNKDEMEAANFVPPNGWVVSFPLNNQYIPTDGSQELCSWLSDKDNFYIIIDSSRAEDVCNRTENLFRSRGIDCELEQTDELDISNGKTMYVYHFTYN